MHATALKHLESLAEKPWNARCGAASLSASVKGGFTLVSMGCVCLRWSVLMSCASPVYMNTALLCPINLSKSPVLKKAA